MENFLLASIPYDFRDILYSIYKNLPPLPEFADKEINDCY